MAWDRLPPRVAQRERARLLAEWIDREVRPFSSFWADRLDGVEIREAADLVKVRIAEETDLAKAGGPGNPGLLLQPTEDGFKRHAGRAELFAVARELRGGGAEARRAAFLRRYRPVHVHEAGVALLLAIAYTRTDLDRLHLAGARLIEVLGLGSEDVLVNAVPAGPSVRFWGLYHAALATRMTALHPRLTSAARIGPLLRSLALAPATVLAAPADHALGLLEALDEAQVNISSLRTVLVVGPPPGPQVRGAITEAAARLAGQPVRVQAVWAPEAARSLWGECRPRTADPPETSYGLHTSADLELLEVRDIDRDAVAAEGGPGELIATSLGWRGTALVRHATGAWTGGLVTSVPCPNCGRTVPRLAPQASDGAWQPRVRTKAGHARVDLRRAPPLLRDAALQSLGVTDWSLGAVDGTLVLGLTGPRQGSAQIAALARRIGAAVGVVPEVRLGDAGHWRPRLGTAGPPD